jgi:hypothetical protein
MRLSFAPLATLAAAVSLLLTTASCGAAQDDTKPLLSEEIRNVLEADGPQAAQRRFDEIFPDQADRYEIDMERMVELAMERMQANDMESGQAVSSMVSTLTQAQMAEHMPEVAAAARAQQEQREAPQQVEAEQSVVTGPGQSRDDLERFVGDYGEPDKQGAGARNLVVGWTCDGYLWMTANWGDASPWHMTSVGETKFEHSGPYVSFKIEFEVDESGNPIAMLHDLDGMGLPSRLQPVESPWGESECLRVERGGR